MKAIKLSPAFKDYLWGGNKLKREFNKKSCLDIIAESWELSTHKDGSSIVTSGDDRGLTLTEYVNKYSDTILGSNAKRFNYFPILIKLIDAKNKLSIQVHPDDEYALKNEGEYGKTEMWYIIDAEPGAYLYYGVNREITKEEFSARIADNTITEVLNKVKVHKGDVYFIDAGTVHAIGEGIIICEIQQNSNTTYRVYDYDRRDAAGNLRPLHIKQAIDVSSLTPSKSQEVKPVENFDGYSVQPLAECKYFCVNRIDVNSEADLKVTDKSFQSLIIIDGEGTLISGDEELPFIKGDSIFIPAENITYTIKGNCSIIQSYV